eukprot:c39995_g1_i1 orf=77-259(+)
MLAQGLVGLSSLVKKMDGLMCLCVDDEVLKVPIVKTKSFLARIDNPLDYLARVEWFNKLG